MRISDWSSDVCSSDLAVAFWLQAPGGEILLRRRPEQGLLGGMMEVPSTPWRAAPWDAAEERAAVPELVSLGDEWRARPGVVRHTFTHFHFAVTGWADRKSVGEGKRGAVRVETGSGGGVK